MMHISQPPRIPTANRSLLLPLGLAATSILLSTVPADLAWSQESSLFHRADPPTNPLPNSTTREQIQPIVGDPSLMQNASGGSLSSSFTFMPAQSARILRLHEIVFIRVDEIASSTAQGNASSRKTSLYDANLLDWVKFQGLSLKRTPMQGGDPRVQGQENEVYRATSQMQTREAMIFNIAATIEDIRPNGTIVLSGQKTIEHNDNVFEFALSGICRSTDIGPDNTILSKNIHDLKVTKVDRGHVRDAYSRGWFTRFIARIKPF